MSGFKGPNYTQVPNELFDVLPLMREAELKVVLHAIRQTIGFHRESDAISLTQFEEATGLSRQGVIDGINDAEARGVLKQVGTGTRGVKLYALVIEVDQSEAFTNDQSTQQAGTSQLSRPDLVNAVDTQKKEIKPKEIKSPKGDFRRAETTAKSRPEKKPPPHAPWFDALVTAFDFTPERMTKTLATQFWTVAAELKAIQLPVHAVPVLFQFVKEKAEDEEWRSWSVMALSKYATEFMRDYADYVTVEPKPAMPEPDPWANDTSPEANEIMSQADVQAAMKALTANFTQANISPNSGARHD